MDMQYQKRTCNFLNPEDEAKILNGWGGKDFVQKKYPAVWDAIKRTKEYQRELQRRDGIENQVKGHIDVTYPNMLTSSETGKKGLFSLLDMYLEDGTVDSDPSIQPNTWPYAMLSGTINNDTDKIVLASTAMEYYDTNKEQERLESDTIYSDVDFTQKRVSTFYSYSALDFNDVIHQEENCKINPQYTDNKGDCVVKSIDIKAPFSRYGNDRIKILYDRQPDDSERGMIDYSYSNVRVGNDVKLCLPIQAEVAFTDGLVPADKDSKGNAMDILVDNEFFRPKLIFYDNSMQEFFYNYPYDKIKQCFTRNQYILNIDFSTIGGKQDYWSRNMSMHNYETAQYEVGRTVYLNADFMVRVRQEKFGVINSTAICIRSTTSEKLPDDHHYYRTNNGQSVYIPTISIRWGCFAEDTMITMAEGVKKRADEIRSGDVLFSPSGPAKVKVVYCGNEQSILCICTEQGRKLKITPDHPVVLDSNKIVRGRNVRPGQGLKIADDKVDKVKWVYEVPYVGKVYNFEFEDGKEHIIIAEDIFTGDYIAQNSCLNSEPVQKQPPHRTPQTQAIVEQLSALERIKHAAILQRTSTKK